MKKFKLLFALRNKLSIVACFFILWTNAQQIKMRFTYNDLPVINTKITYASHFSRITNLNGEILFKRPNSKSIYHNLSGDLLDFGLSPWILDSVKFDQDTIIDVKLEKELDLSKYINCGLDQISLENKKYLELLAYYKTHNYLLQTLEEEEYMFTISIEEQIQLKKDIEQDLALQKVKLDSLTKDQAKLDVEKIYNSTRILIVRQIEYTTKLIEKRNLELEKINEKFKEDELRKNPVKKEPVKKIPVKKTPVKKSSSKKVTPPTERTIYFEPPVFVDYYEEDYLNELGREIRALKKSIHNLEEEIKREKERPKELEVKAEESNYVIVEEEAMFPGGQDSLKIWLKQNLHCPQDAKEVQGRAYMRFVVEIDGSISNVSVVKGVPECPSCDQEAIRLVKSMPKWKPAKNGNRHVRQFAQVSINFTLN